MIQNNNQLNILSISYAHILVSFILIYYIILPLLSKLNTNINTINLFKNYYISDKFKILLINYGVVFTYLKIAEFLPNYIPILYRRILIIIILEVLFNFYISQTNYDSGFINLYRNLTRNAGWFVLLWNIFYITITGKIADKINQYHFFNNKSSQIIIISIFTLVLFHL